MSAFEWQDTRDVHFDSSVMFNQGHDFWGWNMFREELHTPVGSYAIWPEREGCTKMWSAYGGPDGLMMLHRFWSKEEAKAEVERWVREALEAREALETSAGASQELCNLPVHLL
jgi:hypothetical protein